MWAPALTGRQAPGDWKRYSSQAHARSNNRISQRTISPCLRSGLSEAAVRAAFLSFNQFILLYDLTEQWVLRLGAFTLDLGWLSARSTQEQLRDFSESTFR